jgi:hypothetical protein
MQVAHGRCGRAPATASCAARPGRILPLAASAPAQRGAAAMALPPGFQDSYVQLANQLADAAGQVTTKYFRCCVPLATPSFRRPALPHVNPTSLCHNARSVALVPGILPRRTAFDVESKGDASPVTIADKQAETVMRQLIEAACPEHGIFGEEHGLKQGSGSGGQYTWVLDPIDGTKSFITGGWVGWPACCDAQASPRARRTRKLHDMHGLEGGCLCGWLLEQSTSRQS